jgi:hypothetical protein
MRFPRLTKRGYAVRLPTGEYRGVYRDGRYYTLLYARVAETERSLLNAVVREMDNRRVIDGGVKGVAR